MTDSANIGAFGDTEERNRNIQQRAASRLPYFITESEETNMAIKGMDISYWQGNVDFARVAADGIKFAILL